MDNDHTPCRVENSKLLHVYIFADINKKEKKMRIFLKRLTSHPDQMFPQLSHVIRKLLLLFTKNKSADQRNRFC